MLPNEQTVIENIKTRHNKYFVPLAWATSIVTRARKEGRIKDDFGVKTLNDVRLCREMNVKHCPSCRPTARW